MGQPEPLVTAYAAVARSQVAVIAALNGQVKKMEKEAAAHGGRPDAEVYRSQPGFGVVSGARALGEFGEDRARYADAKSRKNHTGTSPPLRLPARRGRRRPSTPGSSATTGSSTRCARRRSPR